jgi:hypothetical protein
MSHSEFQVLPTQRIAALRTILTTNRDHFPHKIYQSVFLKGMQYVFCEVGAQCLCLDEPLTSSEQSTNHAAPLQHPQSLQSISYLMTFSVLRGNQEIIILSNNYQLPLPVCQFITLIYSLLHTCTPEHQHK